MHMVSSLNWVGSQWAICVQRVCLSIEVALIVDNLSISDSSIHVSLHFWQCSATRSYHPWQKAQVQGWTLVCMVLSVFERNVIRIVDWIRIKSRIGIGLDRITNTILAHMTLNFRMYPMQSSASIVPLHSESLPWKSAAATPKSLQLYNEYIYSNGSGMQTI